MLKFNILKYIIFFNTFYSLLAFANYWDEPFHFQAGLGLNYNYFHLEEKWKTPELKHDYSTPGFSLRIGSAENIYFVTIESGGDIHIPGTKEPDHRFLFFKTGLEVFLKSEKLGNCFNIKKVNYTERFLDPNTQGYSRELLELSYSYHFPINEDIHWNISSGILSENYTFKGKDFFAQIQIQFILTDEQASSINSLKYTPTSF